RRWLMLLLFFTVSMSNAYQWIQYGIISNIIMKFYAVEAVAVDMISMVYMIFYILLIVPSSWLLEKKGMRVTLISACVFNSAGAWIKVASARPDLYWVTLLGQCVCAIGQVLILGIPPRLAAVWFGQNEVSSACSIGVIGNQLGCAIGFLVPPLLVPNVDHRDVLGNHLRLMFYTTAGVTTALLVLVVVVFQKEPPSPPTLAQAKQVLSEGSSYSSSLLRLLQNRAFALLLLSYGILVGASYTISTLLNRLIIHFYPGEEKNAGRTGLTFILTGIVASLLCGLWLDRSKTFKQTTFAMYLLTLVGMLVFTFTLDRGHLWLLFITTGIVGLFMFGYLPLGFEYGVELSYPEAEGTSSGLLNCSAQVCERSIVFYPFLPYFIPFILFQVFGIIFIFSEGSVIDRWGPLAGNIFLSCFLLIGTVTSGLIKSELWRQKANLEN
ncbi:unnamed protein product, partial [Tetraodon nigroviridis]